MAELRCRYCGGVIRETGDGMGQCESCRTRVALPRIDKESLTDFYNRAQHLRAIHDYDAAISAYEHIIAENPRDPDARWNLVLCRYGVEYTYDKRTGQYLPSINRMSLDSILNDRDYRLALEYSEGEAQEEYRREAQRLAAIQDELEKIVKSNQNYDVFICFKATDQKKRTRDYQLAQDIYDTLTNADFRVFFSPVSLRQHIGEQYEPYIFAALYSAKTMVLVGTQKEYLQSEWVRNEWSRYLYMTRQNAEKHILPVYEGMKPEDFPAEISRMQGISMNTVGALELIKERVKEYTGEKEKAVYVRSADGAEHDLTNVLRRIQFSIEDGDFERAANRIAALEQEFGAGVPELMYLKLFADHQAKDERELALKIDLVRQDPLFDELLQKGTEEQKRTLESLAEARDRYLSAAQEQQILDEIEALYKNSDFDGVLAKVQEVNRRQNFSRQAELANFYDMALPKKQRQDLLKAYRKLVGDGSDYLQQQLKQKHPDKASRLYLLNEKPQRMEMFTTINGLLFFVGIIALVLWLIMRTEPSNVMTVVILAIAAGISLEGFLDGDGFLSLLKGPFLTFGIPLILMIVVTLLGDFVTPLSDLSMGFFKFLAGIFYGEPRTDDGLGIFIYLFALINGILCDREAGMQLLTAGSKRKKRAQAKEDLRRFLETFEKQEMQELSEQYRADVGEDWVPIRSILTGQELP